MPMNTLDQFNFHHKLVESGGTSLVVFTAQGCGACRRLKRVFESHPGEFSSLALYEVDAQHEMALTREFEIFHLPAMFLYHEGEFHAEIQAEPLPGAILAAIGRALAAPPMEAP